MILTCRCRNVLAVEKDRESKQQVRKRQIDIDLQELDEILDTAIEKSFPETGANKVKTALACAGFTIDPQATDDGKNRTGAGFCHDHQCGREQSPGAWSRTQWGGSVPGRSKGGSPK